MSAHTTFLTYVKLRLAFMQHTTTNAPRQVPNSFSFVSIDFSEQFRNEHALHNMRFAYITVDVRVGDNGRRLLHLFKPATLQAPEACLVQLPLSSRTRVRVDYADETAVRLDDGIIFYFLNARMASCFYSAVAAATTGAERGSSSRSLAFSLPARAKRSTTARTAAGLGIASAQPT